MRSRFHHDDHRSPQLPRDARSARGARGGMYHFQANPRNQSHGPREDTSRLPPRTFEYRHPPPRASERPLLTTRHVSPETLTFPANHTQDKFRAVEDLSDADEAEMDVSRSTDEARSSNQVQLELKKNMTDEVPRWSNPDPYTALPPVEESNRKHKDVVKLIRKARVETASVPVMAVTNDQDFISFDGDDLNTADYSPPLHAPTGPKAYLQLRTFGQARQTNHDSAKLGKRKRDDGNEDEEDENQFRPVTSRKAQDSLDGMVLPEWRPTGNVSPTPWLQPVDSQSLEAPGISLHKEVIDFYEWIKPRDFEHTVRADVITRLEKELERLEPGGRLKPFGSFAAGLYLPTGDMDLVFLRPSFRGTRILANGRLAKPRLDIVHTFANFIRKQGLAQGAVKAIVNAKVPIIKFVDKVSGLRVDLSFDNDTGVTANETFHKWKLKYPAMPVLVSIVKHFLMMRGLNDVAFGGLGGFSTICLVTSLVQHFPSASQPPNLGLMLLEFFNLYGNLFNRRDIAIRLNPPGYISKASQAYTVQGKEMPDCLSIIDPHRQDNNISAGSHDIQRIVNCFSKAHETLQHRLHNGLIHPQRSGSLLNDVLGGNFTAYELQRQALYNLYTGMIEKGSAIPPPPSFNLPLMSASPLPSPLKAASLVQPGDSSAHPTQSSGSALLTASTQNAPNSAGTSTANDVSKGRNDDQTIGKGARKAMNRALRFQELRPDILNIMSMTRLTLDEAVKLGGYRNPEDMQLDLDKRAKAAGKTLAMIKT